MGEISYCPSMQLQIMRYLKTSDCLLYLSAYVKVLSNTLLNKLFLNCPLERAKIGLIYIIIFCRCKCHCNMSFHFYIFFQIGTKTFFIFKLNISHLDFASASEDEGPHFTLREVCSDL